MVYSRATTSAMADRWVLPAGFLVLDDIAEYSQTPLLKIELIYTTENLNVLVDVSWLVVELRCR